MRPTTGSGGGSLADGGGALTPMMLQYRELKRRYPDYLLLFRLGDFYETFFEDAEVAARLLQITLTSRQGAPMAGIPHHAADGYLARTRSEEHTSELQSLAYLVCRLLLEKKKKRNEQIDSEARV